jgi:hypothetical protein
MLTRDGNIVMVEVSYQYVLNDVEKYYYQVDDPTGTLRLAFETIIRRNVQTKTLDDALLKKKEIGDEVMPELQKVADLYNIGITITGVHIQNIRVPDEVQAAYEDVNIAKNEQIKLQEDANVTVFALDTGNLLHGPWGPVGPDWLVALLVTRYDLELSRKTLDLAGKFKARRLAVVEPGLDLGDLAEYSIALPEPVDLLTAGLSYLIPLQLLTYYWSVANGLNPDAPAQMRTMLDAMLPPGREEPEMRKD